VLLLPATEIRQKIERKKRGKNWGFWGEERAFLRSRFGIRSGQNWQVWRLGFEKKEVVKCCP
jgi:hypothetical protein